MTHCCGRVESLVMPIAVRMSGCSNHFVPFVQSLDRLDRALGSHRQGWRYEGRVIQASVYQLVARGMAAALSAFRDAWRCWYPALAHLFGTLPLFVLHMPRGPGGAGFSVRIWRFLGANMERDGSVTVILDFTGGGGSPPFASAWPGHWRSFALRRLLMFSCVVGVILHSMDV